MVAVIPVRDGALPAGAAEAAAEAGTTALVVGERPEKAAGSLPGPGPVDCIYLGTYAPGRWAEELAPHLDEHHVVVLPASADGRDLAPRLAQALGRPLLAGAVQIDVTCAVLARRGGLVTETHTIAEPVVATLLPGIRGVDVSAPPRVRVLPPPATATVGGGPLDAAVVEVLPPDPATMDLAEARRVVAGGAGLGRPDRFGLLARVAAALGATPGATRVVADAGWVDQHRYIGTTGVSIDPDLYVALGVSGAVQHVTGIGHPEHIVAVNTDPSAPMMAMADVAIVTDAVALLEVLAARLGLSPPPAESA